MQWILKATNLAISLAISIYKIIVKDFANSLHVVLEKIILKPQNDRRRQILDTVFIANECLDSRLIISRDQWRILNKVDIEKIYNLATSIEGSLYIVQLLRRWDSGEKKWQFIYIALYFYNALIFAKEKSFISSAFWG